MFKPIDKGQRSLIVFAAFLTVHGRFNDSGKHAVVSVRKLQQTPLSKIGRQLKTVGLKYKRKFCR